MEKDITNRIEMVMYQTEDDDITVSAVVKDESIWITQKAMAELFGVNKSSISRHLTKIFEAEELDEKVVVAKIATTTQHGAILNKTQTKLTNYYNLDVWAYPLGKMHLTAEFLSLTHPSQRTI